MDEIGRQSVSGEPGLHGVMENLEAVMACKGQVHGDFLMEAQRRATNSGVMQRAPVARVDMERLSHTIAQAL